MAEKRSPYEVQPERPPLKELRGVVERITYQNPESGFTVARFVAERADADTYQAQDNERLITVVGTLGDVTPGEAVVAHGWWRNDAKHGWQFNAVDYRTTLPATVQGMKKYLGSGLVKGIGPVNAARIVEHFGESTFAIIDEQPDRLNEVAGIGPIRAGRIASAWLEQRHIREVMTALQGFGVSTSLAVRIYKKFGDQSARVVSEEPYRLAREVWGIGFRTADKIARAVGIAADSPQRIEAGLLFALNSAGDDGHTVLPQSTLIERAAELLEIPVDPIEGSLTALRVSNEVAELLDGQAGEPRLALAPFARAETGLASRLQGLAAAGSISRVLQQFRSVDWDVAFGWLADKHSMLLAPEQAKAVQVALTEPVSILTGGPGTGKTHTLKAILALARAKRLRCLLAAPTGRAAKRMNEATGIPAATLHRLLELRPGARSSFNQENPLPGDLIIVDETSMLDTILANQLIKAIAQGTHLVLVGDPDQLPSVGAGEVLADLIRSERFAVTRLERIFRQGAGSGIARNAKRINGGEVPEFGRAIGDCFFVGVEAASEAADTIVELVSRRLPNRYRLDSGDIQVLAPMHRGDAGVAVLNTRLQEQLNPGRTGLPEARAGGRVYRPGDRVLQLRNDYDLSVFNGDLGVVRSIDPVEQEMLVVLDDGRDVRYPFASLYALTHAYAISIHKSQGAEFRAVVIPLLTSHAVMLSKTLLYTAFTRARELVVIVGQAKALRMAVRDWRRAPRQTGLLDLLTGKGKYEWQRDVPLPDDQDWPLWEGTVDPEA